MFNSIGIVYVILAMVGLNVISYTFHYFYIISTLALYSKHFMESYLITISHIRVSFTYDIGQYCGAISLTYFGVAQNIRLLVIKMHIISNLLYEAIKIHSTCLFDLLKC